MKWTHMRSMLWRHSSLLTKEDKLISNHTYCPHYFHRIGRKVEKWAILPSIVSIPFSLASFLLEYSKRLCKQTHNTWNWAHHKKKPFVCELICIGSSIMQFTVFICVFTWTIQSFPFHFPTAIKIFWLLDSELIMVFFVQDASLLKKLNELRQRRRIQICHSFVFVFRLFVIVSKMSGLIESLDENVIKITAVKSHRRNLK